MSAASPGHAAGRYDPPDVQPDPDLRLIPVSAQMPTPITALLPQIHPDRLRIRFLMAFPSVVRGGACGPQDVTTSVFQSQRATAQARSDQATVGSTGTEDALFVLRSAAVSTIQGLRALTERSSTTRARFERRLHLLADEAEAAGDAINPDSEAAFRWFLNRYEFLKAGRLFLMDNGNLRATWKDERDTHVGLQFLPADSVQYVIFTRRPSSRTISRGHGYDTLDAIPRILAAYDLGDILGT